jgi:hypothetical protein
MAKYLDGIQSIDDVIQEFKVIGSGTITVGTNQFPATVNITRPSKIHRNYLLVARNSSGQSVNNVNVVGLISVANSPLPNSPVGTALNIKQLATSPALSNNLIGVIDITAEEPNPFAMGDVKFQFNLAAAPTSGTIDWALIGY